MQGDEGPASLQAPEEHKGGEEEEGPVGVVGEVLVGVASPGIVKSIFGLMFNFQSNDLIHI